MFDSAIVTVLLANQPVAHGGSPVSTWLVVLTRYSSALQSSVTGDRLPRGEPVSSARTGWQTPGRPVSLHYHTWCYVAEDNGSFVGLAFCLRLAVAMTLCTEKKALCQLHP